MSTTQTLEEKIKAAITKDGLLTDFEQSYFNDGFHKLDDEAYEFSHKRLYPVRYVFNEANGFLCAHIITDEADTGITQIAVFYEDEWLTTTTNSTAEFNSVPFEYQGTLYLLEYDDCGGMAHGVIAQDMTTQYYEGFATEVDEDQIMLLSTMSAEELAEYGKQVVDAGQDIQTYLKSTPGHFVFEE